MDRTRALRALFAVVLVVGSFALVACGSDDDSSSSSSDSGSSSTAVDTAAADKILAPVTGKPTAFPVNEPLVKKPGGTLAYMQCVTPVCGLFPTLLQPATKLIGQKLAVTKAGGPSADQVQAAMESILATKPTALFLPAVEPATISTQIKDFASANIPISSNGIMNHQKYGIPTDQFNTATAVLAGKSLAAWVVKEKGAKANAVFYNTPELSFSAVISKSFSDEMKALCADCKVRQADIPVSTIGSTAPARVVSDLQANADTNVAVIGTMEAATGLPAAMKTAGLTDKVTVTGFAPNPAVLQYIKTGQLASGFGLDLPVMTWTQVDAAARLATGEPLTAGEKVGIPPVQMLEKQDLQFDVSKGWTGYPDFPARFAKLWGAAK